MQQQYIDLMTKLNTATIETTRDLIDINVRAFEKYAEKQTELVNDCMNVGLSQLESAGRIKDEKSFSAYCDSRTKEMQKCADKFHTSTKEALGLMAETSEKMNAWMKKGMDTAATTLNPASPKKA